MNDAQKLWWEQAKSDLEAFACLRRAGLHACHTLHYLQMVAEKISKAYLWRSGNAPPRSHVGLMPFFKALLSRSKKDLQRIAQVFGFARPQEFKAWIKKVSPLAHQLQGLAPDLAKDGPNPEYPWPHAHPEHCPATYPFDLWSKIRDHVDGRTLLRFIERAVQQFEQDA